MPPSEIQGQTVAQLQEIFLKMTSAEWDLALQGKPPEVRSEAARMRTAVQRARLSLENEELAAIRDKLIENEEALEKGRQEVARALERLEQVERVLTAVSSLLGIVGRIVSLA